MKIIKKILLFTFYFSLFILMFGCSTKTTPIYAVIKTPKIKVADQGFIKEGFGYKDIVIYKAGNVPVKIRIKNSQVCMDGKCIDKETFVKEYLSKDYPADFFDKILNKECIKGYFCKSSKNKIIFKDRKHNVLIILKNM